MCIYIYIYIYIYRERERERGKERDKETYTQRERVKLLFSCKFKNVLYCTKCILYLSIVTLFILSINDCFSTFERLKNYYYIGTGIFKYYKKK